MKGTALMNRLIATLAIAIVAMLGLTACSGPAESIAVGPDTVVIDVRTPAEYDAGHLDGAVNLDVQSADFDSMLAELPADGEYVVYCKSGNRSAAATARMVDAGFTSVEDAGGMTEAAESTGIAVVAS